MVGSLLGDLAKHPVLKPLFTKIAKDAKLQNTDLATPERKAEAVAQLQTEIQRDGCAAVLLTAVIDGKPALAVAVLSV